VTHPEGRNDKGMPPALKWFFAAAGVLLLLFILFPLLRTTDDGLIDPAPPATETVGADRGDGSAEDIAIQRQGASSDDAESVEEAFAHAEARALVIRHIEPNELRVGGAEFRVKRHPGGHGTFVYDPRTHFAGVERNLVWWIPDSGRAYALNSPSKQVTPALKWPHEDGLQAPDTAAVMGYVFRGEPMQTADR
jgi:hypothetical protein